MTLEIGVRHAFPEFALDVEFQAPPGVTVLFGPSGSGKSTVVAAVAGLLRPDRARIAVDGTVLTDTDRGIRLPPHRRRIGVIFQDGRLFPHLSVRQNLQYGRWFARGRPGGARTDTVVDLLGIGHLLDRAPATLSGGERQRVAIGRALLSRPQLILADEPLSALDEARKQEIMPYFERLRDHAGVPILYVSHAPAEVARLATTVVALRDGKVAGIGTPSEVFSTPQFAALSPSTAGAVIEAEVSGHDDQDGLTRLSAGGIALYLPRIQAPPGARIRLRIAANEVMLARTAPEGISALNLLPGRVESLQEDVQGGVQVRLMTPAGAVLARITRRSARELQVAPGQPLTAIVKSLAPSRDDIGTAGPDLPNGPGAPEET
ncbi:molybdenum ABC transporter ATP-binding protein [Paracoccus pacificus]|uniref:Molybdenum ABC transporter ATP-binding protein n=1 Tax=Paracoccus pacificus TaxID=1463598 RepID=A0ABW4R690_9RHOB